MNIFVANEQTVGVDEVRLVALASHTLQVEEVDEDAELSILLVGPDHIERLNKRFAGNGYVTDVLAFPMMENDENSFLLGDVVICPQVAEENAAKVGHQLGDELDTLLVHGTLHLLGYDHQGTQDKAAMDKRLQEVLASFAPTSMP